MRDLLEHRPARPDTLVPGGWLLELPNPLSQSTIELRRFRVPIANAAAGTVNGLSVDHAPAAESSSDAQRRATAAAHLQHQSGLDSAWRAINATEGSENGNTGRETIQRGAIAVLQGPIAIVVPESVPVPAQEIKPSSESGKGTGKELWVFEFRGLEVDGNARNRHETLDSLELIGNAVQFRISDMLSCKTHGSHAACCRELRTVDNSRQHYCRISFKPADRAREWKMLGRGIVEKLAWQSGRRVSMVDHEGSPPHFKVRLSPFASGRLLLRVEPRLAALSSRPPRRPAQYPMSSPVRSRSSHAFVRLRPLNLAAKFIGDHVPTPEQITQLEDSFGAALGAGWTHLRSAWRLSQQAMGDGQDIQQWGIYWVPVGTAQETTANEGVLTIWPNHLVDVNRHIRTFDKANRHDGVDFHESTRGRRNRRRLPPAVKQDPVPIDNMMNLASGLFDFLSNYKEPPPVVEEAVEEPSLELPPPTRGEVSGVQVERDGDGRIDEERDKASDSDDLFDSRSPSPNPNMTNQSTNSNMLDGNIPDMDAEDSPPRDLPDPDTNMDGATPPHGAAYSSKVSSVGNDDGYNAITEDDFDFFDSPEKGRPEPPVNPSGLADGTKEGGLIDNLMDNTRASRLPSPPLSEEGKNLDGKADDSMNGKVSSMIPASRPGAAGETPMSDSVQAMEEVMASPVDLGSRNLDQPSVEAVTNDISATSASPTTRDLRHRPTVRFANSPTSPCSPLVSLRPPEPYDLIPSPFSALPDIKPLHHAQVSPSTSSAVLTSVALSPAPSPEALRTELLDRLKSKYIKKQINQYHCQWFTNEDISEDDETEADTNAPPTPESMVDWEEVSDGIGHGNGYGQNGHEEESGVKDVEYDGVRCVGAEWVWLMGDEEVLRLVKTQWKEVWGVGEKGMQEHVAQPERKTVTPGAEMTLRGLERIAREIISNRHYRRCFLRTRPFHGGRSTDDSSLTRSGVTLSDIMMSTPSINERGSSSSHVSSTSRIHVGFAGNVIRLSIASLRYWKQLGLSPLGGPKDVTALAICRPGEVNMKTAEAFLNSIGKAWTGLRLGTSTSKAGTSVVMSEPRNMVNTINSLLTTYSEPLVLYVLLDDISDAALTVLGTISSRPDHVIHLLPTSGIHAVDIPSIVIDVYNRISRKLAPFTPDRLTPAPHKAHVWYQYPSFTLAPDNTPKPEWTMSWPLRSYDVLNRWRLIHAAYGRDAHGRWVVMVMDGEGENWDVRVWQLQNNGVKPDDSDKDKVTDLQEGTRRVLEDIWEYVTEFAGRQAIEYRVAMARLGVPGVDEMNICDEIHASTRCPCTILFADALTARIEEGEPSRPPVPPVNITPQTLSDPSSRLIDDAHTFTFFRSDNRLPVRAESLAGRHDPDDADGDRNTSAEEVYFGSSWTSSVSSTGSAGMDDYLTTTYHVLSHRAAPKREDEGIEEVLAREYQKMTYLAKERFGFDDALMGMGTGAGLPVHLACVAAVLTGFERLDESVE